VRKVFSVLRAENKNDVSGRALKEAKNKIDLNNSLTRTLDDN
jgi:hypothetical protein